MSEYPNSCFHYIVKTKFYGGTFVKIVNKVFSYRDYIPVFFPVKFYRYYTAFTVKLTVRKDS